MCFTFLFNVARIVERNANELPHNVGASFSNTKLLFIISRECNETIFGESGKEQTDRHEWIGMSRGKLGAS